MKRPDPRRPVRDEVLGEVRSTRSGYAFLAPESGGEDLLIARGGLGGAIHGDRVRASMVRVLATDYRPEVMVEEILERRRPLHTGELKKSGKAYYVRPDSPLLPERLPLRLGTHAPVSGEKVLFRVENLTGRDETLIAVLERALGDADDARLDPIVIGTEFGLPLRFSDAALEEAEARAAVDRDPEDAKREDFRDRFVLSIDPIDAKDFDDAVAIRREPGGGWELAVHIADVSFYVREGSALDQEAEARGTSVYFPGTVVPMLPEVISSIAASLRPGEDKRVLSAILAFDAQGTRIGQRFTRGWIRSSARLHYAEAQAILNGDQLASTEVTTALRDMAELAALLRRRRFEAGAFDLDVPEVEMTLGADGVPIELHHHETHDSNRLIEEFMIAANLAVGSLGSVDHLALLYRVHAEPDARAIEQFALTALALVPSARESDVDSLPALRRWLKALPESPRTRVLHRFFLRSLKKAEYSAIDVGHFGLAVRGYCHFTSPIRRYPDLWNHRRLKERLDGARARVDLETTERAGRAASAREVNAEEADREMARLKAARFLARHVGAELSGIVTALTPRGLFVELLRWPVEGFVARDTLRPGTAHLEERVAYRHERSGWELRPGDKVKVVVVRADVRQRRSDFALVASDRGGKKAASSARRERLGRRRAAREAREKARSRSRSSGRAQRPPRAGRGASPRPPKRRSGKKRG